MCKQSQIVTSNVINRVLNIRIGDRRGTGFTIEVDGRRYLITARHVTGEKKVGRIGIEQEKWVGLDVKTVGIGDKGRDVAVLAADRKLTTDHEIDIGSVGITMGQDVRFLGFPLGLRMGYVSGKKGKEIPMVKAGILSGISRIEEERRGEWLWVDGHNNKGFSGGPIVFKPLGRQRGPSQPWKIAGVISGYVWEEIEVEEPDGKVIGIVKANSGILAGVEIELAMEMIDANPIWVRIAVATEDTASQADDTSVARSGDLR